MKEEIKNEPPSIADQKNQLYPIFLKLENINTLLVGGGNVGLEKLHSLFIEFSQCKDYHHCAHYKGRITAIVLEAQYNKDHSERIRDIPTWKGWTL